MKSYFFRLITFIFIPFIMPHTYKLSSIIMKYSQSNSLSLFNTLLFSLIFFQAFILIIGITTYPIFKNASWIIAWPRSVSSIINLIKIPFYIFLYLIAISFASKTHSSSNLKCIITFLLFVFVDLVTLDANNLIANINTSTFLFSSGMYDDPLKFNPDNVMTAIFHLSQTIITTLIFASFYTYINRLITSLKDKLILSTLTYFLTITLFILLDASLKYLFFIGYKPQIPIWKQLYYSLTNAKMTISLLLIWTAIAINHRQNKPVQTSSLQTTLPIWITSLIFTIALLITFSIFVYILNFIAGNNTFLMEIIYILDFYKIELSLSIIAYIIYLSIIWQNIHFFPYTLTLSITPLFYVMIYAFIYQSNTWIIKFSFAEAILISEVLWIMIVILFGLLHVCKKRYYLQHNH